MVASPIRPFPVLGYVNVLLNINIGAGREKDDRKAFFFFFNIAVWLDGFQ